MEKTPTATILVLALLTAPALAGGVASSTDETPSVWLAEHKLVTSDVQAGLGSAVDTSNGTAAVSTPGQHTVQVLEHHRTGWETVELQPPGPASNFGADLAIDAAGDTIVVGAWGSNEVFVYEYQAGAWSLGATISGPAAGCIGYALDVSPDGEGLLASEPCDTDAAYLYERDGTGWSLASTLEGQGERFGWSLALESDTAAVASMGERVTVFQEENGDWVEDATLTFPPSGTREFARSIDLADDRLVAGDPSTRVDGVETGAAYIFEAGATGWQQTQTLAPSDLNPLEASGEIRFGVSVDVGSDRLVVGAPGDDRLPSSPAMDTEDRSDPVCTSLSLSPTCYHPGAAYVFEQAADGEWGQEAKLTAADSALAEPPSWMVWDGSPDAFGASVAQDDGLLAVGAPSADLAPPDEAGAAYLYSHIDGEGVR